MSLSDTDFFHSRLTAVKGEMERRAREQEVEVGEEEEPT